MEELTEKDLVKLNSKKVILDAAQTASDILSAGTTRYARLVSMGAKLTGARGALYLTDITLGAGLLAFTGTEMVRTLNQINTEQMGLHFTRNILHFAGQNLWFYALVFIPLSQLFAFEFTNPLWVAILAPLFLGERMTWTRVLAFGLGFVGVLIVARPGASPPSWPMLAAALCAVGFAGAVITTKMLAQRQSITCILFWLVGMQAVFGLIAAGYDGDIAVPDLHATLWVSAVGLCGLAAHFCITSALKIAPATVVAPLEFLRLPLIAIVGAVLYGEALEIAVFAGALIVFAANWLNIRAEQAENLRRKRVAPETVFE